MAIDLGIGAIILAFALVGLASGFWPQVLRLIALASLYFIAPPVARELEGPVSEVLDPGATEFAISGAALIVAAVGLYIIMSLIIALFVRMARRGREVSGVNRFAGFVLGGAKGVALTYLLLCGFVMVAQSADYASTLQSQGWWVRNADESRLVSYVSDHNVLEQMGYELPTPEEVRERMGSYTPSAIEGASQTQTPEAVTPEAAPSPGAVQPGAVQPGAVQPGAVQPGAIPAGSVPPPSGGK